MWTKRKDEEPRPASATQLPTSVDLTREGIPMSTLPTRGSEPPGAVSVGKSVIVKGQIYGREDLYVDGEVEGTIELQEHRLTVGPNGKVKASVKAREVVIRGTVHGNIDAGDRIDIRKEAKLVGDLKAARIVIEDGAYFKGSIDIARPEVTRTAPVARAQPTQPAPAVGLRQPPIAGSTETKG